MAEQKMSRDAVRRIVGDWQARLEAAEAENERLREALNAIRAWLKVDGGEFHTGYGDACGEDACIVCLVHATASDVLSTTEEPARG